MKTGVITNNRYCLYTWSLLVLLSAACRKEQAPEPVVSEEEAAEAILKSGDPASGGFVRDIETMANSLSAYVICNIPGDTGFTWASSPGAVIDYQFIGSRNWLLVCDQDSTPISFSCTSSLAGSYSAPRMASDDVHSTQLTLTGLGPDDPVFICNAQMERYGTQVSRIRSQRTFTSTITANTTDLTISKQSNEILGGSLQVTMSGSSSSGATFTYAGTLEFHGGRQATISLNNGGSYPLTW